MIMNFWSRWNRRKKEVTDGEMDTNFVNDKMDETLESFKDTIEKQLELENKSSNYHTTKEQGKIIDAVFKDYQTMCQALSIDITMDSVIISDLPRVFEVLKGKLDRILRKGLGLTLESHIHLLELAQKIENEIQYPGASDTYCLLLEWSKWENKVKSVIRQQVCAIK